MQLGPLTSLPNPAAVGLARWTTHQRETHVSGEVRTRPVPCPRRLPDTLSPPPVADSGGEAELTPIGDGSPCGSLGDFVVSTIFSR
jgi:hypothetical protein